MRTLIYKTITNRLKELLESDGKSTIKTFDLWNEQVAFAEEEIFDTPAVFIEFDKMPWKVTGSIAQTDSSLVLHIVSAYKGSSRDGSETQEDSLSRFDFLQDIIKKLHLLKGGTPNDVWFNNMLPLMSDTNHDHGELIEDIEQFSFKGFMKLK